MTKQVIVADKTGEVHAFPWPLSWLEQEEYSKISTMSKEPITRPEDKRFMGLFLLGHSSSVVALTHLKTKVGKFLVSVDRDEHVRISVFPETYIIHAMGLGHTAFVSAVLALEDTIITGGGDKRIIQWDMNGNILWERTSENGSCVRYIRLCNDEIFVIGERYFPSNFPNEDRTLWMC